jgi:hypothetical protein
MQAGPSAAYMMSHITPLQIAAAAAAAALSCKQVKVGGDLAFSRKLAPGQRSVQLEVLPREPRWVAPEVSCYNSMLSYK